MIQAIKLTAQLVTSRDRRWRGLVVEEEYVSALQGSYSFHIVIPNCLAQLQNLGWWLIL